jgi:hypothetical protein
MELLHILVANDTKALGWSTLLNQHINVDWKVNPKTDSRMFSSFDQDLLTAMGTE